MKCLFLALLLSVQVHAIYYETQFENDHVCIAKVVVEPYEEVGLHRDLYPQVVIALKGGVITRLEANGEITEVNFPQGEAVFRKADPPQELHRSVNRSCEPIELIIIQLKDSSPF